MIGSKGISERRVASRRQIFLAAAAGGCLALAAVLPPSRAIAAPEGKLKSMSLELTTGILAGVTVVSSNGTSWTGLKPSDVSLAGSVKIEMKIGGRIKAFGIYLGTCSGHACFEQVGTPLLGSIQLDPPYVRSVDGTTSFSFSSLKLGDPGSPGIAVVPFGSEMVARCNAGLKEGQSIHKGFGFTHTVQMTLGADTRIWNGFNFGSAGNNFVLGNVLLTDVDFSKTVNVQIPVVCEAVPLPTATSDLKHDFGDFDVKNVKLFLTTVQPGEPGSIPGTVCPRLKVTSRAQTNQAGPVTMRIWRKKNNGPISSQVKQAWAAYDAAKNGYFASYEQWEHVGTTSTFQFKTEIVENDPFLPFDGWKDITVNCTGAGGGGLAPNTSSSNPDDNGAPAPLQLKGDFKFLADKGTSCPRKAKALINFTSSVKDNIHYSLDCTNGQFSGVAKTAPKPGGGYVAPALVTFDVTGTTQANCALKSVAPGKPKVHTLKGHLFQCVKTTAVTGSKNLQVEPRSKAAVPQRKGIAIPAPVGCEGGKVRNGKCACESGQTVVIGGLMSTGDRRPIYRCVAKTPSPKLAKPHAIAPQRKIACANGRTLGGKCVCGRGFHAVAAGANAFRCVRTATRSPIDKRVPARLHQRRAGEQTLLPAR